MSHKGLKSAVPNVDRSLPVYPLTPDMPPHRAIAAGQLQALKQHYTGKLRLFDVKEMFLQMKDQG
jgi:hypothetical protein